MKIQVLKNFNEEKYLKYAVIIMIITVVLKAYLEHPIFSTLLIGDESFYYQESEYLKKFGLYKSLTQGTSVLFSVIIVTCAKLFGCNLFVAGRIYSVIAFLASTAILYKILKKYTDLSAPLIAFTLIYFACMCRIWLWLQLADLASMPLVLGAFYLLLHNKGYKSVAFSGLLLFLGFAIKPTCLIMLPAFVAGVAVMRHQTYGMKQSAISVLIMGSVFLVCFGLYHIPGYKEYGKLMLESKNHTYNGEKRVENKTSWVERNIYLELYNVNNKINNWHITWEEVDSFKTLHPEINLNLSLSEYITQNPVAHAKKTASKIGLFLPYNIQSGFFFSKWNIVNHWIKDYFIIQFITMLIIAGMYFKEREIIKKNKILFLVVSVYFLSLSVYVFIDLQSNWLLWCIPFFALPVVSFLTRYINIVVLIFFQFLFTLLI